VTSTRPVLRHDSFATLPIIPRQTSFRCRTRLLDPASAPPLHGKRTLRVASETPELDDHQLPVAPTVAHPQRATGAGVCRSSVGAFGNRPEQQPDQRSCRLVTQGKQAPPLCVWRNSGKSAIAVRHLQCRQRGTGRRGSQRFVAFHRRRLSLGRGGEATITTWVQSGVRTPRLRRSSAMMRGSYR